MKQEYTDRRGEGGIHDRDSEKSKEGRRREKKKRGGDRGRWEGRRRVRVGGRKKGRDIDKRIPGMDTRRGVRYGDNLTIRFVSAWCIDRHSDGQGCTSGAPMGPRRALHTEVPVL